MTGNRSASASACARGTRWPCSRFLLAAHLRVCPEGEPVRRRARVAMGGGGGGRHRGAKRWRSPRRRPAASASALRATRASRKRPRRTRSWSWRRSTTDDGYAADTNAADARGRRRRSSIPSALTGEESACARVVGRLYEQESRRGVRRGLLRQLRDGHGLGSIATWARDVMGLGGARRDAFMAAYSFLKGLSQMLAGMMSDRVGRALADHSRLARRRRLVARRRRRRGVRRPVPVSRHSGRAVREPRWRPAFYWACSRA